MAMYTTVRSWSAIAVGVFFTLITCWVLLEDVWHGAPLTTRHIMTLAVLAGTIYFGHRFWIQLRALRMGTTIGCAVLFLAGTATCVTMSAGRNAEAVNNKALAANSVNVTRAAAQKDRDEARIRYQAALKAEEDECSSGAGGKCTSKRTTRMERRKDYDDAEAKLREQRPEQVANADIRASAELFSRLPFVTASPTAIEALLLLFFPFMQSLFCEVGAICGFAIGLGHAFKPSAKPQNRSLNDQTVRETPFLNGSAGRPQGSAAKYAAERDLVAFIAQHGHTPSQEFLRERWGKSKGTVSCWLQEWEQRGLIRRRTDGRVKITSAGKRSLN